MMKPFAVNLDRLESEIATELHPRMQRRDDNLSAVSRVPLPTYIEPREGVSQVGALTAQAVVAQYEAAAKEFEAMGQAMIANVKRAEEAAASARQVFESLQATAAAYREEGKRIFQQIEECALLTEEVRTTCDALRSKIAKGSEI